MSAYVGLAALKEAVGLTGASADTVDDGVLTSLIYRASALVDGYLDERRPGYVGFASGSNSRTSVGSDTRVYDGTGTDTLFIDDAASVATVSDYTVSISSNSWRLWPYNGLPKRAIIYALPVTSTQGLIVSHWLVGTANVAVTGYFGLPSVPNDVEQVTLAVAIALWRRYQAGEAPSTAIDAGLRAILAGLDPGWAAPGVWGA